MGKAIKVSVIIPVYNMSDTVKACLDMVISQTLEEKEIICINDGSSDNTLEVLEDYAKKYECIKVFSREHGGISKTRNFGIKQARGEFISFMDADDYYANNNVLEVLYRNAIANEVFVSGGLQYFKYDDGKLVEYYDESVKKIFNNSKRHINELPKTIGFTDFIYNRELIVDNKIEFPWYLADEDTLFFLNAMVEAQYFFASDIMVYTINKNYNRINKSAVQFHHSLVSLVDRLEFSYENGIHKITKQFINAYKSRHYEFCRFYLINKEECVTLTNRMNNIVERATGSTDDCLFEDDIKYKIEEVKKTKNLLIHCMQKNNETYIYGAGNYGVGLLDALTEEKVKSVDGFVVSNVDRNANSINNLPILQLDKHVNTLKNTLILVSVSSQHIPVIEKSLKEFGILNYIIVDTQCYLLFKYV